MHIKNPIFYLWTVEVGYIYLTRSKKKGNSFLHKSR